MGVIVKLRTFKVQALSIFHPTFTHCDNSRPEEVPSIPRIDGSHKLHSAAGNLSPKLSTDDIAFYKLTVGEFLAPALHVEKETEKEC